MSRDIAEPQPNHPSARSLIAPSRDGRGDSWSIPTDESRPSQLRVRAIERTAIVRFVDAEILFEEAAVRAISQQLHLLVRDEAYSRLVVSLAGVRYISSDVLGILASLQKDVEQAHGRITLCGLDPLLRDMVRITHLDRVFDICNDEAEALGLMVC